VGDVPVERTQIRLRRSVDHHELRKANSFAAFSVREVRNKTGASIVVNAGSTASYSIPAPVGLLQIGGQIRNKPNHLAERAGVLCLAGDHVSILPLSSMASTKCIDAVQRGPFPSQERSEFPTLSQNGIDELWLPLMLSVGY
jgi:hypothetical protein